MLSTDNLPVRKKTSILNIIKNEIQSYCDLFSKGYFNVDIADICLPIIPALQRQNPIQADVSYVALIYQMSRVLFVRHS